MASTKIVVRITEQANAMVRQIAERDGTEFGATASELIVTGYNRRAVANAYAKRKSANKA
jgi:hypothetical protein